MFIKSIRWRLQIWLAFLLIFTLSGFGFATFEAHRIKQYQQMDEELGRRVEFLAHMVRGRFFPGGRPPFDARNRTEPSELRGNRPPGWIGDSTPPEPPGPETTTVAPGSVPPDSSNTAPVTAAP